MQKINSSKKSDFRYESTTAIHKLSGDSSVWGGSIFFVTIKISIKFCANNSV